jgi:CDP-glycerol glycerophosphotransferase (TagB/SpsB family)
MSQRSVIILNGPSTHLDHLGILSAELNIPLMITDHETLELAQKMYPAVKPLYKDHWELSLNYLSDNYDLIFHSGKYGTKELDFLFQTLFQKKARFIYCPHGNSDKGYSLTQIHDHSDNDIVLAYGEHMADLLKTTNAAKKIKSLLLIGNYRFDFYQKHRAFYDELTEEVIFSQLEPKNKTILYAPTWNTRESPSSFFDKCAALVEQVRPPFNLIIKLHPFLEQGYPGETWHIIGKYDEQKNILFLRNYPPIYPLIERCALYLGDFSSIGYDFLSANKPLFFFESTLPEMEWKGNLLHRCGMTIPNGRNKIDFIEENLEHNQIHYEKERERMYSYAFSKTATLEKLKEWISEREPCL